MKILWAFSSFEIGGAQRRFASLAPALGAEFSHIVSAMDGCYDAGVLLGESVDWRRRAVEIEKGGFVSRVNIARMADLLAEVKPDILCTTNWGTIEWRLANRSAKIPHIHVEDGFGPDEALGARNPRRDLARRILFSRAATGHDRFAFVAPSTGMVRIFTRAWGAGPRVAFIPNGVDVGQFPCGEKGGEGSPAVIGSVGALRKEKRFDRLLRIFAEASRDAPLRLLLVGDGPERQNLEQLCRDLRLEASVTFTGAQSRISDFLEQMDIYAIASDTEQMPISLIEAMASGLPVVGSDVGDVGVMLDADNRPFIVPPGEERKMAASLLTLAQNRALRTELGKANARKARAEYSLDRMTQSYREMFARIAR